MFVYIRTNDWFKLEGVVKLGVSTSLADRTGSYITGEVVRGEYLLILEIHANLKLIDNLLKAEFKHRNINKGGGTEFYDVKIEQEIIPFLESVGVPFTVISCHGLKRKERIKPNAAVHVAIEKFKSKLPLPPMPHQAAVLDIIEEFYDNRRYIGDDRHNENPQRIGKIVWACGLGKAYLSVLIVKKLKCQNVLYGVPSEVLQTQMAKEIRKAFKHSPIFFLGGDHASLPVLPNSASLPSSPNLPHFTIATYHSIHKFAGEVDIKIGDESHHLVSETKHFSKFHDIKSAKTLLMTATDVESRSFPCSNQVIGKRLSVRWAIENKRITDYLLHIIENSPEEIEEIVLSCLNPASQSDAMLSEASRCDYKALVVSCYACLASLASQEMLTHILLYVNEIGQAEVAERILTALIDKGANIYVKALHSKSQCDIESELVKFRKSPCGIVPCVYMFGEGCDMPFLNGVCVALPMRSEVRIVQYLLRPHRLNPEVPGKIAHIILPFHRENPVISHIVSQLRIEDETIGQKIRSHSLTHTASEKKSTCLLVHNPEELERIKLTLWQPLDLSLRQQYELEKIINSRKNYKSRQDYKPNHDETEDRYAEVWGGWYDFLGIDKSKFPAVINDWKLACQAKKLLTLEEYLKYCDVNDDMPLNPGDIYSEYKTFVHELGLRHVRRNRG